MADHIHILAKTPKSVADADFIRNIKCNSTNWIKGNRFCPEFGWQEGYGWFSIGASMVSRVSKYIQNQAEHHKTLTFRDEFVHFLEKYKVEFDERFLWENRPKDHSSGL